MDRIEVQPRTDWEQKCEQVGFSFYGVDATTGAKYWDESAAYGLTMPEVEVIEAATLEVFNRTLDAVDAVITADRFDEFAVPESVRPLIRESWDDDDPTVYGRFDLACGTPETPKMLEFNADTPTSLLESSVVQWFWLRDVFGEHSDQFNSLHEKLIAQWRYIREQRWHMPEGGRLHLAYLHDTAGVHLNEDFDTAAYMSEVAGAAGFSTKLIAIEDITWNDQLRRFEDGQGEALAHCFKLYPWEWMSHEAFGAYLPETRERTQWVEPMWKMLLSNKQILVVLSELFPKHPNILRARNNPEEMVGNAFVRKPKLSREGANVQLLDARGKVLEEAGGDYGEEGYIYQAYHPLVQFAGRQAVVGSWIVGDEPAGINFRESIGGITTNTAAFVPHYIK